VGVMLDSIQNKDLSGEQQLLKQVVHGSVLACFHNTQWVQLFMPTKDAANAYMF